MDYDVIKFNGVGVSFGFIVSMGDFDGVECDYFIIDSEKFPVGTPTLSDVVYSLRRLGYMVEGMSLGEHDSLRYVIFINRVRGYCECFKEWDSCMSYLEGYHIELAVSEDKYLCVCNSKLFMEYMDILRQNNILQ